jgi:hypothetical protein
MHPLCLEKVWEWLTYSPVALASTLAILGLVLRKTIVFSQTSMESNHCIVFSQTSMESNHWEIAASICFSHLSLLLILLAVRVELKIERIFYL